MFDDILLVEDFVAPVDVNATEVVSLLSDIVDKGVSVVPTVLAFELFAGVLAEDALVTDVFDADGLIVVLADTVVGVGVAAGTVD